LWLVTWKLFGFFVRRMFAAVLAKLAIFQPVLEDFLVLATKIVRTLTNRALELDHVILGHSIIIKVKVGLYYQNKRK